MSPRQVVRQPLAGISKTAVEEYEQWVLSKREASANMVRSIGPAHEHRL